MFDLFFQKYKAECHEGGIKNMDNKERIMFIVLIVSGALIIYFSSFNFNILASLLFLIFLIINIALLAKYERKKEISNIDYYISNYKENVIKRLIIFLSDEQFNLYTLDGLNWMINSCEEHINPKKRDKFSIFSIILPIFTLVYGVIINNMNIYEIIVITAMVFIVIVFFNFLYNISIHDLINNPDKILYKSLKSELEYIRVQMVCQNSTN